jgi:NTP pyrophosphatase (non-canonical NTP hydrolase)
MINPSYEREIMDNDKRLKQLLVELLIIMKETNPQSEAVKGFIRARKDDHEEFADLAATVIFMAEEANRKNGEERKDGLFKRVKRAIIKKIEGILYRAEAYLELPKKYTPDWKDM